jgi:PPM family protein phosphatase
MRLDVAGRSDVGKVRSHNEDRYAIRHDLPDGAVFCVVADGVGGYASGDLAATLAVERVLQSVDDGGDLSAAVASANAEIYRRSQAEAEHRGMGTTLTCVRIGGGQAEYVHAGDSRMYLIRDGGVRQLTTDHSWVAEEVRAGRLTPDQARRSPSRNLITRALGLENELTTDQGSHPLVPGDALLLCSDGIHTLVGDDELVAACARPAEQGSQALIDAAMARGAPDNVTVIIARVLGDTSEGVRVATTRPLPDLRPAAGPPAAVAAQQEPGPPPTSTAVPAARPERARRSLRSPHQDQARAPGRPTWSRPAIGLAVVLAGLALGLLVYLTFFSGAH